MVVYIYGEENEITGDFVDLKSIEISSSKKSTYFSKTSKFQGKFKDDEVYFNFIFDMKELPKYTIYKKNIAVGVEFMIDGKTYHGIATVKLDNILELVLSPIQKIYSIDTVKLNKVILKKNKFEYVYVQ